MARQPVTMRARRRRALSARCRGEDGFAEALAALVITALLVGAAFLPAIVSDLDENSRAWRRQQEQQAGLRRSQAPLPWIGPAPPNSTDMYTCWTEKAAEVGLRWTNQGWRSSRHPEPVLTGNVNVDRGAIEAWKYGLENFIAINLYRMEACRPAQAGPQSDPAPVDTPPDFSGTYAVEIQGGTCQPAMTLKVTHKRPNVTIEISAGELAHSVTGSIAADGHFDIRTTVQDRFYDQPVSVALNLRGQFVRFDQDALLRGGVLSVNIAGQPCQVSFTGRRQR